MRAWRAAQIMAVLLLQVALGLVVPAHHHSARPHAGAVPAESGHHHEHPAPTSSGEDGCSICLLAQGLSAPQPTADLQKLELLELHSWPEPLAIDAAAPMLPFFGRAPPASA